MLDYISGFDFVWNDWYFLIGIIICWQGFRMMNRKRKVRKVARDIHENVQNAYNSGFRWKSVDLDSFHKLDLGFYHRTTELLLGKGYQLIGDVEYLHVTESNPNCRTCVRMLISSDGKDSAAIWNLRVRGWQFWLLKMLGEGTDYLTVEFQSALSDGRFIMTNNTGQSPKLSSSRKILSYTNPESIPVAKLLTMHRENLAQFDSGVEGAPTTVEMHSLEEVIKYEEIQHELQSLHRTNNASLTEEELDRLGPDLSASDKDLFLEELKRSQEGTKK